MVKEEEMMVAKVDENNAPKGDDKPKSIKAGSHLKKPEDITAMLEFPSGTTSSLCRFMTKEVFDKYHGKKDKAGVSFE